MQQLKGDRCCEIYYAINGEEKEYKMTNEFHSDFSFNYELRNNYLYVLVSGPKDDFDISNKLWKDIYAKTVELGVHRILVEEDFPNQLTTIETYRIAEIISKMFKGNVKIAHVDQHKIYESLNKFGETEAVNRGLLVKIFNNITDGEKWLIK